MRIIDDKGRLFGKINIIDFSVLAALLIALSVFFVMRKLFIQRKAWNSPTQVREEVTLPAALNFRFIKVRPEIIKLIAPGDKERDSNGRVIGEIIKVGEALPYSYKFNLLEGRLIEQVDPVLKEVPVTIKLEVKTMGELCYYKDKQIAYGSEIDFITGKYSLSAQCVQPLQADNKLPKKTDININIPVILKGLTPEQLALVCVGDKELDAQGRATAEIISLGKSENDIRAVKLASSQALQGEDTSRRQLNVMMRLAGQMTPDNHFFYQGNDFQTGPCFTFQAARYSAAACITQNFEGEAKVKITKTVKVQVKFADLATDLAKIIKENNLEKDIDGQVIGELKKIISTRQSRIMAIDNRSVIMLEHPLAKDVVANLELITFLKEGTLYYKNYPVKVGNSITFSTETYSVSGVIQSLSIE